MKEKPAILVSACLLGVKCRYDGGANPSPAVLALAERYRMIPICPEEAGGLPTPRKPSERRGGAVVMQGGLDVTAAFEAGAEQALLLAGQNEIAFAVLKAKSPSCGSGEIYDGSFSHTLRVGDGVAAELLKRNGYRVFTEKEIEFIK